MHTQITLATRIASGALVSLLLVAPIAAQQSDRAVEIQSYQIPGWSFTPSVAIGLTHDTNIALSAPPAEGRDTQGDSLFDIVPAGQLKFLGKHTDFSAGYAGFVRRYVEIDGVDEFAQRASLSFTRHTSRRLTVFLSNSFADSPTTDEVELNGVPFRRAGSQTNRFGAATEYRISKLMLLSTRYDATWVAFDDPDESLTGGWIHAIRNELSRTLNERVSVGGEYSYRTASLNVGERQFDFHDAGGVIRFTLGPHTTSAAAAGLAALRDRTGAETRSGPYVRLNITHARERATFGAGYQRRYVPSFGFGGASGSHELTGDIVVPLPRNRVFMQASGTWRRTSPFEPDSPQFDSFWLRSTIGFAVTRWARLQGHYAYVLQDSIVTGGEVDRHRLGVQLVISQPIRIR